MGVERIYREWRWRLGQATPPRLRAAYEALRAPATSPDPPRFAAPSKRTPGSHLALVIGHFTFEGWYATFGDTGSMRVVLDWLDAADVPFDVACHPAHGYVGVDYAAVDPAEYTIVVFVCGPWTEPDDEIFLGRFAHCVKVGVNVSVVGAAGSAFDLLFARDTVAASSPDLMFASSEVPERPLAGLFRVHEQPEYGTNQRHDAVARAVDEYLGRGEVVAVPLDTLHVGNHTSTRDERQLVGVLRRLDVVLTSRLHGLVYSLRAGVPTVAIDPVSGGGKVTAQARAVGYPLVLSADEVDADAIGAAVRRCLDGSAAASVDAALATARTGVARIRHDFVAALSALEPPPA